jgi:hypothetical protein
LAANEQHDSRVHLIAPEPVGIVHVLIPGDTPEHGLP